MLITNHEFVISCCILCHRFDPACEYLFFSFFSPKAINLSLFGLLIAGLHRTEWLARVGEP